MADPFVSNGIEPFAHHQPDWNQDRTKQLATEKWLADSTIRKIEAAVVVSQNV